VKLGDLNSLNDQCFFCGYTIGDAAQTKCPECGRTEPTVEEIRRVDRATRVGKIGSVVLILVLAGYGLRFLGEGFHIAMLSVFGLVGSFVFLMMVSWARMVWWAPQPLYLQPCRRRFAAVYPWLLVLALVVLYFEFGHIR
jgi:hypothetical protein